MMAWREVVRICSTNASNERKGGFEVGEGGFEVGGMGGRRCGLAVIGRVKGAQRREEELREHW